MRAAWRGAEPGSVPAMEYIPPNIHTNRADMADMADMSVGSVGCRATWT